MLKQLVFLAGLLACFASISDSKPTPKGCDQCKVVVKAAEKLARNGTALNETIAALKADCDKYANSSHVENKICKAIVQGLGELLPFITKELDSLAWDELALCAAIGLCSVPCCAAPSTPEQVHLSLTRESSEMAVTWVTLNPTSHIVQYGVTPTLGQTASGHNTTYTWCGWIGQIHTAVMTGLSPKTTYYYRVGDPTGWSKLYNFTTLDTGVGSTTPLRVVLLGDMGYGPNSDQTVATVTKLVQTGQVDAIFHNGDISYADGDMEHWDMYFRKIEPFASRVPYMVSPGNHEFWFNFSSYKHRFWMPLAEDRQNMYYSLNIGALHLIAVDTESIIDTAYMSKTQLEWLKLDLQAVNRQTQPWLLSMGHRPIYCSNHNRRDCNSTFSHFLQEAMEDLLYQFKVDLHFQSHVHNYERTWPMYRDAPTSTNYSSPSAPVYVVNGAGGNREGNSMPPGNLPWTPQPSGNNHPQARDIGFSLVVFQGRSMRFRQFAANNTLLDDWTLSK